MGQANCEQATNQIVTRDERWGMKQKEAADSVVTINLINLKMWAGKFMINFSFSFSLSLLFFRFSILIREWEIWFFSSLFFRYILKEGFRQFSTPIKVGRGRRRYILYRWAEYSIAFWCSFGGFHGQNGVWMSIKCSRKEGKIKCRQPPKNGKHGELSWGKPRWSIKFLALKCNGKLSTTSSSSWIWWILSSRLWKSSQPHLTVALPLEWAKTNREIWNFIQTQAFLVLELKGFIAWERKRVKLTWT